MQFEYSFTSIPLTRHRDGLDLSDDYREIIRDRAQDGWQFVQAISFEHHRIPRIDLVFSRKGASS